MRELALYIGGFILTVLFVLGVGATIKGFLRGASAIQKQKQIEDECKCKGKAD